MVDKSVVESALKYLDECFAEGKQATLVGMLNYVDHFVRVVLVLDEVNEVFNQRPSLCFEEVEGQIRFTAGSGRREMTADELNRGTQAYYDYFWARYKKLTGQDPPDPKTLGSNWP